MAAPRVAVVGTGFGARVHVPALRAAGFEVVALVGTDEDRTRRRADRVGVEGAATNVKITTHPAVPKYLKQGPHETVAPTMTYLLAP